MNTPERAHHPFEGVDGPTSAMSFSQALSLAVHEGAWIRRECWDLHHWIGAVRPEVFGTKAPSAGHAFTHWRVLAMEPASGAWRRDRPDIGDDGLLLYSGSRADSERNGDGPGAVNRYNDITLGWTPNTGDMLAQDWTIYTP